MTVIICLLFVSVALIASLKIEDEKQKVIIFWCIAFCLIMVAGFRTPGKDYSQYVTMFRMAGNKSMLTEPTFLIISQLIKWTGSNVIVLFLIYAALGVSLKFIAIKELTPLWFLSILFYLGNIYILHELIQIRAGIASALLLLCIKPVYEQNLTKFLIIFGTAVVFHYSALVMFPIWFLNKDKIDLRVFMAIIPIAYLVHFMGVNLITTIPFPAIREKIELYRLLSEKGGKEWSAINLLNLVFLAKIFIYYYLLIQAEAMTQQNKHFILLLKTYGSALVSFIVLSSIPVISFRIYELLSVVEIILFPFIYYTLNPRILSKAVIFLIGLIMISITLFYNKLLTLN